LDKLPRYGQVQHAVAAKRNSSNYARLVMPKEEWSWDNWQRRWAFHTAAFNVLLLYGTQLYERARYEAPVVCTNALSTTDFTLLATEKTLHPEEHKSRAPCRHGH